MILPVPCSTPCPECPWRRASAPGWLGPWAADEWVDLVKSDEPIACHLTLPTDEFNDPLLDGETWESLDVRQCAGAAIFRKNIAKLPRYADVAVAESADRETVFASGEQFLAHHAQPVRQERCRLCGESRPIKGDGLCRLCHETFNDHTPREFARND